MNPILRNILAVIIGWFGGSLVNMWLINMGMKLYMVEEIDPNDMEAFAELIPTLPADYFYFPFLAHALGTLVGATITGLIVVNHKMKFALAIGVLFLIGGIAVNILIPGPTWFAIIDILLAYIPMAWIGGKIAQSFSKKS